MRKKIGLLSIMIGLLAIILALLLYLYNFREDEQAGKTAEELLQEVQTIITEEPISENPESSQEKLPASGEEIAKESEIDNSGIFSGDYEYIGVLSLPSLELTLPVLSECSDALLKVAPCRDYGDLETDDLVIAAHNYRNHFGRLHEMKYGAEVELTDMNGVVHRYIVSEVLIIQPTEVSLVWDSSYELVLYTCDYTNQNRVVVYCKENIK